MHVDCRLQTIYVERKWFAQKTSNKVFIIETSIVAKTSSVLQIVSFWQTHQIFRIFKYDLRTDTKLDYIASTVASVFLIGPLFHNLLSIYTLQNFVLTEMVREYLSSDLSLFQ